MDYRLLGRSGLKVSALSIGTVTFGAGVLFFPVSYIFGDVLTEVYGYGRDRRVIWAGFGALIFAYYLATFANYTATYAGLASVMIVLIFLYMVGVIFIVGAEINAALMKFRVLRNFSRTFSVVGRDHAADSKPDKTANIGG